MTVAHPLAILGDAASLPCRVCTPARRVSGFVSAALLAAAVLTGCATSEPAGSPRAEVAIALTEGHELIRFNTGQPQQVLARVRVSGLQAGDELVGIDFRVAHGRLYALARSGRLYTLDAVSGQARVVGGGALPALVPSGQRIGFDFNPTVDRIRVVGDDGQNYRLHPETGAAVDGNAGVDGVQGDGMLAYASGDANQGRTPRIAAAGYTYNKLNEKITTNFAIDLALGALVIQGTREGAQPAVSPNTGRLFTIGALGLGALDDVSFDIADVSNAAFATVRTAGSRRTQLVLIDLATGRAQALGTVGRGEALRGFAIEP
jgi:hypothetical protein